MRILNKIGFWGWVILLIIANIINYKSCDMGFEERYLAYQEFWIFYLIFVVVFFYMWLRDWSKSRMFDFRK